MLKILNILICSLLFFSCSPKQNKPANSIGLDPTFYGVSITGLEPNVKGFIIDLLTEVNNLEGLNLNIIELNSIMQNRLLDEKKVDAIVSPLTPYPFNQALYEFSEPFLKTGPVLVVPYQSKVHDLTKLNNMEIATITGTDGALILERYPDIIIRSYNLVPEALTAIVGMQVDGALIDSLIAEKFVQDLYSGFLKVATHPLSNAGLRLVALKDHNPELISKFNKALKHLESSGKYTTLLKKWSLA